MKLRLGETGFEPATSASRTQRSSQAELLSAKRSENYTPKKTKMQATKHKLGQYQLGFEWPGGWEA